MLDLDSLILLAPLGIVAIAITAIWLGVRHLPEKPPRRRPRS
jgi:hypothetical protein